MYGSGNETEKESNMHGAEIKTEKQNVLANCADFISEMALLAADAEIKSEMVSSIHGADNNTEKR